ncbi:MAG: heparinase II/III family protein [Rariglobus sp.]
MFRLPLLLAVGGLIFSLAPLRADTDASPVPEPARVAEIAALLDEASYVPGRPAGDRAAWEQLAAVPSVARYIGQAERDLGEPTPVLTQALFELYKTKGTRPEYETPFRQRSDRLARFALAECLENRGRFLPAVETELAAILSEPTWVVPAHWYGHGAAEGFAVVDLASSARASTLAVVDAWLGARLKPETRAAIRREVEARVWRPYLAGVRSGKPDRGVGWMRGDNNWNAVCHAGVIGSALLLIDDRAARAEFIAAGEIYLPRFLGGFSDDGYCSEGIGYWNYGFGSYLYLAETVRASTHGKIDWLTGDKARAIALYPSHLEIFDGLYPTYADGAPGVRPSAWMRDLMDRRLALGHPEWRQPVPSDIPLYHGLGSPLLGAATVLFVGRDDSSVPAGAPAAGAYPLRDEFPQAQVFTLRPAPGDPRFGVSFKGGHNDEHHNHNDLGSYVVAMGRHTLLLDPGMEQYTSRTFSARRYESRVLASYGHDVPLVAGRQQSPGRRFAAEVVSKTYSDSHDEVTLNLAGGYEVPGLESLLRTFAYTRGAQPELVMRDTARFAAAESFGTALVTFSRVERSAANRLVVYERDAAVEVIIDTQGAPFTLTDEVLPENLPGGAKARRLGINLNQPSVAPAITLTIRPAAVPATAIASAALPAGTMVADDQPAVRIEAEAFISETGGKVEPVARVEASGLGIRNWDKAGHSLGWRFSAPKDGRYAVRVRYALGAPGDSLRTATLDGKPLVTAKTPAVFTPTGGWSSESNDWREVWLGEGGEAVLLDLKAGGHTLILNNEQGALNLDRLELVPVK